MGFSSDDDSSSDSSGHEYLVTPGKLNLDSTFFQQSSKSETSSTVVKDVESSGESSDDDFVVDNDEKVDTTALLAEVMKNLENANKSTNHNELEIKECYESPAPKESSPKKKKKIVLSDEITNLLLQGESGVSSSAFQTPEEDEETPEEKRPAEYTIPKEGVDITLPGTSMMMFGRRKKRGEKLEDALRRRMNQRLRSNQVYIHKVGLMCWLAHGFHLNFAINDAEVLSTALSLVPSSAYPKGRVDLKYLEQFTKWFRNLFRIEFKDTESGVRKEILLGRLKEKKVHDHRELVLLYSATLRAIGLNCRLVVSLCPPALKLSRDQLFQNPSDAKEDTKKSGKNPGEKIKKEATTKSKVAKKRKEAEKQSDESRSKIVAENSSEVDKTVKLDARKRAADVLARFANNRSKKSIKIALEKKLDASPEKLRDEKKSPPKMRQLRSRTITQSQVTEQKSNKIDEKKSSKDDKSLVKRTRAVKNTKEETPSTSTITDSDTDEEFETTSSVKKKKIDAKAIKKTVKDLEVSHNEKPEKSPGKRTRAAKGKNEENPSTSIIIDSDTEDEFEAILPAKKKKIDARGIEKSSEEGEITVSEKVSKSERGKRNNVALKKNTKNKVEADKDLEKETESKLSMKKKKTVASKNTKIKAESVDDDSDEDFDPKSLTKKTKVNSFKNESKSKSTKRDSIDRRVLSSDEEPAELVDAKGAQNIWVEVFVESEESWISVSVIDDKIHCVSEIYKKAPKPVLYVVAWNSVGTLKDVTRRYCPHWLTVTRKQRVDESWWVETLSPWDEKSTAMSRAEDEMLLQRELEQPLPKTVGECKGHPLYALARHLLKFEAIYPPESVPLGHLRTGEAIYSRHCVHTLCSRETWIKKARVVKPAQDAYKIVKSMPKYDKLSGIKLADQPLELFGKWQTTQYVPPVAKDGIVPRNEYGNVDLFKQCMLPIGTVHINLPALNRVARKLNIDCVPAVVGFNFGARGAVPAIEGYVVCEEFEETLRAAWQEDQIESAKRAQEKHEKRVYGNWKKLIKGLFIRERLAARYDFNDEGDNDDDKKPSASTKRSNKKVVEPKKITGKKSKTS